MAATFVLVLRGRPGLGHVTPGLAIARELRARGHRVRVLTYANGARFLESSGWDDWEEIDVAPGYRDWPGLDLYDHGVQEIAPRCEALGADFLILGGEYLLAPLGEVLDRPTALLLNPEILESGARNRLPGRLFGVLFESCELLVPLHEPAPVELLPELQRLAGRFTANGPFLLAEPSGGGAAGSGLVVLLANGGGVDFPASTASYAGTPVDPRQWLEETREATRASVRSALEATGPEDRVILFSCLGEAWNRELAHESGHAEQLTVHAPSTAYYQVLSRADVVVSRAGAGFLADTATTRAEVVLWTLAGHDEQALNARRLSAHRPRTRVADGASEVESAVASAIAAARREPVAAASAPDAAAARVATAFEGLCYDKSIRFSRHRRRDGLRRRPMTYLSVNLNKVALVRNARGIGVPDITEAARIAIDQGCHGLTIHPREDERHATLDDVYRLAEIDAVRDGAVELNIEGDPRPDLMRAAREVGATQFTVVPVVPGEITTNRGWRSRSDEALLRETIEFFEGRQRISLFVDPDPEGVRLSAEVGAQAIELHTYEYAVAFGTPRQSEVLGRYEEAARVARSLGLRVHAGHDLNLDNLGLFLERIGPEEVSIGHALISRALLDGLDGQTRRYLEIIRQRARGGALD